jgi:hypothetical protein
MQLVKVLSCTGAKEINASALQLQNGYPVFVILCQLELF